jgi:hypothetical protein
MPMQGGGPIRFPRKPAAGNHLCSGRRTHIFHGAVRTGASRSGRRTPASDGAGAAGGAEIAGGGMSGGGSKRGGGDSAGPGPALSMGLAVQGPADDAIAGMTATIEKADIRMEISNGNEESITSLKGQRMLASRRTARTRIPPIRPAGRRRSFPRRCNRRPENARRRP